MVSKNNVSPLAQIGMVKKGDVNWIPDPGFDLAPPPALSFFVSFQVGGPQVSAQTEQFAMGSSRSRKSSGNENAY